MEALYRRFWPSAPYSTLLTDVFDGRLTDLDALAAHGENRSWCEILAMYAGSSSEPILLLLDDFFLSAPVRQDLIDHALNQLETRNAGMVRLYPCPGADDDYGDPHVGIVRKGTPYRISTMAGIWRPEFLRKIASSFNTAWEFEIEGTKLAESLPEVVLAWKRESQPWPLEYICTGITRGKWEPTTLKFFREQGIEVDTSMRPVA